jgi:hypothetical protein
MPLFRRVRGVSLLLLVFVVVACTSAAKVEVIPPPQPPKPMFPPHEAMKNGTYSALLAENQKVALECSDESFCSIALFNLGFVYSYPISPYFNQAKGLYYFEALIKSYPQNPLASEAKAWKELIKKCILTETTKHRLKGELKSKDAAIKELQKQVTQPKEATLKELTEQGAATKEAPTREEDSETDRMEKDIRKKLEQSQAIDAEIDRKERELLQ